MDKVTKTETEWREQLSPEEYRVLRQAGTEAPWTGEYTDTKTEGVYACRANGVPAAINIGVRPMFETGRGILVEAHLIDYDDDLYGRELRIDFLSRLRGERLFDSVDALVEQIARDVARTRELAE